MSSKLSIHGELDQIITRAGPIHKESSMANVRIPPGHPEGYLEGFAQIYTDAADVIQKSDGWTIETSDGLPSAHFEYTIAITKDKTDILSSFSLIEDILK